MANCTLKPFSIARENKFNFMASTCDFSLNQIDMNSPYIEFSSEFGQRPICHHAGPETDNIRAPAPMR